MMMEWTNIGMFFLMDSVGDFLGRFGHLWLETFIMAPFFMLLFIVFTWPLKLVASRSKNYHTIMRCRDIANVILFILIAWLIYYVLGRNLWPQSFNDPFFFLRDMFHSLSIAVLLVVPAYYCALKGLRQTPFYGEEHVPYLRYFILFLRSFKDDEKYEKSEEKLMQALSKLFHPYAIGKPDVLLPPQGAKRIYVGEGWKELVIGLQEKAPVILQRINMTDNFLWEFDQCVQNDYLNKVIFWVTDYFDYDAFQQMVMEKYGLWFPRLFEEEKKTEKLFYKLEDGNYRILTLKEKADYELLADTYMKDHPELTEKFHECFYGHDFSVWSILKRNKRDPLLPEGVDKWDWMACLFPQFYVLCHSTKQKWWLFIITVILLMMINDLNVFGLLFIGPMLLLGMNGRALSWLSHRWESREWFEHCYKRDNRFTFILGIVFWVFQLGKALAWLIL